MNKKITSLLLGVLALGALSLKAQTPASSYSITADFTYTTKYVFRGVQLAKGAIQPSVKLTSGNFYASVWNSSPVDKGYELEFDYTAGWGTKVSETWALDTGMTVYTYPGLGGGADKATYEGFLGFNGPIGVLTSGTYLYYDFTLKVFTVQEALGYTVTIDPKTSVSLLATVGRASPDAGSGYTYWGFGATVPYKLSDKATLSLGVQYADHNIAGLDGNHFWGTIDFNYAF